MKGTKREKKKKQYGFQIEAAVRWYDLTPFLIPKFL